VIQNFDETFINNRYSLSKYCITAKTRFSLYKMFTTTVSDINNGIIAKSMIDYSNFKTVQDQAISNAKNINLTITNLK
jgi:hypothetical protein